MSYKPTDPSPHFLSALSHLPLFCLSLLAPFPFFSLHPFFSTQNVVYCLLFWKHFFENTNSKNSTDTASNIRSGSPLLPLVDFLPVDIHGLLSEHLISGSQEAFRTNFWVPSGYQKAGTSSLKRVTGRIFKISQWFRRSHQKLYLGFFLHKKSKKLSRPSARIQKRLFFIFIPFKNNINLVTLSI